MADDNVTHLANLATDHGSYRTHYEECHLYHLECAALIVCDENKRLRAAIDALLTDIDGDHQPEWSSDEAEAAGKKPWCCAWCGATDGGWPCIHRKALDELKEARRGI